MKYLAAWTFLFAAACSSHPAPAGVGGGGTVDLGMASPAADLGLLPVRHHGSITLDGTTLPGSLLDASFPAVDVVPESCITLPAGHCQIVTCTPPPAEPGLLWRSAGTITVSGGVQPVVLMPGSDGVYAGTQADRPLWPGGALLTVTAAGAEVPPFSASVVTPAPLSVTAPPFGANAPLPVDRAHDFELAWSGGGQSTLEIRIVDAAKLSLVCEFPADDGRGVVPQSLLGRLAVGTATLVPAQTAAATARVTDWSVDISARGTPLRGGAPFIAGTLDLH
jgi:hypothetical protein